MRSYTITAVWGIPIRVNTSLLVFLPILAWLVGSGQQIELYAATLGGLSGTGFDLVRLRAGATPWVIGALASVGLFVSVTLHELGHSWVALRYDIEIESITLWILGGIASLKTLPKEWNREFWIAIAGPATSALVAAVCYVGVLIVPESPVAAFGERLLSDRQTVHLVTDDDGTITGVVTLADLRGVESGDRATTRVGSIARAVPRISPAADAFDTLAVLNQSDGSEALVEVDGEVVGVVSEADFTHALTVQRGFRSGVAG